MSIEDEARTEAAKRWPSYPTVGFSGAEDRQTAFIGGAEWQASRLAESEPQPEAAPSEDDREAAMRWARDYLGDPDESPEDYADTADSLLAAGFTLAQPVPAAADNERVARLAAVVTPLGYSQALALFEAQTKLIETENIARATYPVQVEVTDDDDDEHVPLQVAYDDLKAEYAEYRNSVRAKLDIDTVRTADELTALPVGSVVMSQAGTIACRFDKRKFVCFGDERPGEPWELLSLPARVLYRPAALGGGNS